MERSIPLSTGVGEVTAPHTLMIALIINPDGTVTLDPGALHGRSEIESAVNWVSSKELVSQGQSWWVVWIAAELDATNQPARYKGLSVGELVIDRQRQVGYKSVAGQVNRMSEAMRGVVSASRLSSEVRRRVKAQLISLGASLWEASPEALRRALES